MIILIDSTEALLNDNKDLYKKLFKSEKNLGKGGAVKIGIINAEGEFILFQDADDEYDPNDYLDFVKLIDKIKDLDLIIGSRFNYKNNSRRHDVSSNNSLNNIFISCRQ